MLHEHVVAIADVYITYRGRFLRRRISRYGRIPGFFKNTNILQNERPADWGHMASRHDCRHFCAASASHHSLHGALLRFAIAIAPAYAASRTPPRLASLWLLMRYGMSFQAE